VNTLWPSLRGMSGLLLRSALLLPVALALTCMWITANLAVLFLPVVALWFLQQADWLSGAVALGCWYPAWRWARSERFRIEKNDLVNEYENV
jgi:hypothetical protein